MMRRDDRLESTWRNKYTRPRLEPRILIEEPGRSYHAPHRVTECDLHDNKLTFGDNLLAPQLLETRAGDFSPSNEHVVKAALMMPEELFAQWTVQAVKTSKRIVGTMSGL
jgi:hypothetical protein